MLSLVTMLTYTVVESHQRWACPAPRSSDTGIKNAVCGAQENDFSQTLKDSSGVSILTISPGPLTVVFEESVHHRGAPTRIALSGDGTDSWDKSCVLLDHIPHDENSRPTFRDDSTYHKFYVTVDIPDVNCEKCSLHLGNPMTDKIGKAGASDGEGCSDPYGSCFSVYYSCTKTFRIVGSTGASQRKDYACPGPAKAGWPQHWLSPDSVGASLAGAKLVDASTPGVYRRESAIWSNGWLANVAEHNVHAKYRTPAGDLCVEQQSAGPTSSSKTTMTTSIKFVILGTSITTTTTSSTSLAATNLESTTATASAAVSVTSVAARTSKLTTTTNNAIDLGTSSSTTVSGTSVAATSIPPDTDELRTTMSERVSEQASTSSKLRDYAEDVSLLMALACSMLSLRIY
eukprot:TRINITY_DN92843_c0_g1_i1.p1 TRINITY_DN92843_c0_g1~~TRINITY_DN92843_c0_g1_i1.p1  ORF type:complete len:420 (+),score=37.92 TRINITY_DN92843_c0_g1_i1:55-1260(+)